MSHIHLTSHSFNSAISLRHHQYGFFTASSQNPRLLNSLSSASNKALPNVHSESH